MSLVLMRIDDRLIHGQVVEGWLDAIVVNHILIASDEIAHDEFQHTLLSLAVPPKIKVSFLTIKDASEYLAGKKQSSGERVIVLLHGPREALELLEAGVKISSINVGGMHYADGKKQVLPFLSVDERDREAFEKISEKDVLLEGRVLPGDTPVDIIGILHKVF